MIYQNHRPERTRFLSQKSFTSLEPGGRIIIHEMLFNEDKNGPLAAAAFNIIMLEWTQDQQYTGSELSEMLMEVGFIDIEIKPTSGYWSIVTARKP